MTESTLADLERRGELEIGERADLGDGIRVVRFESFLGGGFTGWYYAARGIGPSELYLHTDGQWRESTAQPGTNPALRIPDYFPGYFDDLPTLLDRLAATLYAEADATSAPHTTEKGGRA